MENILWGQQAELQALPRTATINTERWIRSNRGCWDQKQRGKAPQQTALAPQTALPTAGWAAAAGQGAMAQVQLNTWLILCVFAGSPRLTGRKGTC